MKRKLDNSLVFNSPTIITFVVSLAAALFTSNGFFTGHPDLNAIANVVEEVIPLVAQTSVTTIPDAVRLQTYVLLVLFPFMTFGIARQVRRLYPLQKDVNFRTEVWLYFALAAICIVSIVLPTEDPVFVKLLQIGSNRLLNGFVRWALFWAVGLSVANIYTLVTERFKAKANRNRSENLDGIS